MAKKLSRREKFKRWMVRSHQVRELTDHCVVCFSEQKLVCHHLRYRKGGRGSPEEKPEDLVVLCEQCHDSLHRQSLEGRKGFLEFRERRRDWLEDQFLRPPWLRIGA